jgi:hypothetical protein
MSDYPPIGLMPKRYWEDQMKRQRLADLLEAVARYIAAGKPVPQDWRAELLDYGVVFSSWPEAAIPVKG